MNILFLSLVDINTLDERGIYTEIYRDEENRISNKSIVIKLKIRDYSQDPLNQRLPAAGRFQFI